MQNDLKHLKLYNSLTRKIEPFIPLKNNQVSMYVCGITPYGTTHLGHAFTYISFDILVRLLTYQGFKVNYAQNVTDIDDDILKRAKEENRNWAKLGKYWTKRFLEDMRILNIQMPDYYIKATDSIPTMIKIVSSLVGKGFAYEKKGNVYFEVKKRKDYGKLSRLNRKEMIRLSAERGADPNDPRKHDPLDFILWQKSKADEPFWESPWGRGRPGWHIECSSMIYDYLGPQIDIHGGGEDLIFPHHESEIAQSESFTNKAPFAKCFFHTGNVFYKDEKMSKSLGNLVMIKDLLAKYSPNTVRFLLLSHHYRKEWGFREEEVREAAEKIEMLERELKKSSNSDGKPQEEFINALNNDLDTPKALKILVQKQPKSLKPCLLLLGFQF